MPPRRGHVPGAAPGGSAAVAPLAPPARHRRRHTPRPRSAPRGAPAHAGPSKPCPRAGGGGAATAGTPGPAKENFPSGGAGSPPGCSPLNTGALRCSSASRAFIWGPAADAHTHTDALFPERRGAQPRRGAEAVTCGLREDQLQSGNPRVHRAARPRGRGCRHHCHHNHHHHHSRGTHPPPGSGA